MIIAQELKKTNIAEYILYMWQTEDIIRSFDLDLDKIKSIIIDKYSLDENTKLQIEQWYKNLIQIMQLENIEKSGHLQVVKNTVSDLYDLHLRLLGMKEQYQYQKAFAYAKPHIDLLRNKIRDDEANDIDLCLHGLYGILILKMKKVEISSETLDSVNAVRQLVALLVVRYNEREKNPDKFYE